MTQAEIIKIIDTRLDMLQELLDKHNWESDFDTLRYTWECMWAELQQLKLVIKYEEEKKNGKN